MIGLGVLLAVAGCLGGSRPTPLSDVIDALQLPDPTLPGPLPVAQIEYDLGLMLLTDESSHVTYPSALHGDLHYPESGSGPFPVVVFLHGRHGTCDGLLVGVPEPLLCRAPVADPVDSYLGYDYIARVLASHGYVVASIDANAVNAHDHYLPLGVADVAVSVGNAGASERAQLVLRTLDELDRLNREAGPAPLDDELVGRLDLSRIGLLGHSRGGEGVARAVTMNAARTDGPRHDIRAVFSLAPTDFFDQRVPDVAFATLLPYCDGDVRSLHGAKTFDNNRYAEGSVPSPRIQILAMGANHNYYNTIWTGDDGGSWTRDPYCDAENEGNGRLLPEDQRRHGLALIAGYFRLYVGGEAPLEPLVQGKAPVPDGACPAGEGPCPGLLHVSYHPTPSDRLVVEDTREGAASNRNDLGGTSTFAGFVADASCPSDGGCLARRTYAAAAQLWLAWEGPATWRTEIPAADGDLSGHSAVSIRVGVNYESGRNPDGDAQDFRFVLTDAQKRSASVAASRHSEALFDPPGNDAAKTTLNMVRVPLSAFSGVDLSAIRALEIVFGETPSGEIQVTDLMFQK